METTSNQTISSFEYDQQIQTQNIVYLNYQEHEQCQQETQENELSSNEQQMIQEEWLKEYNISQMLQDFKAIDNEETIEQQEEQFFEEEMSSTQQLQQSCQINYEYNKRKPESSLFQDSNEKPTILLKPIIFRVLNFEETMEKIDQMLDISWKCIVHKNISIIPHNSGYIISLLVKPQYYDLILPLQDLLSVSLDDECKTLQMQNTNKSDMNNTQLVNTDKSNQLTVKVTTRRATMLVDHVELFMSQVESAVGQHRSAFMNGDPKISQHPSGKYLIALDLFESHSDEILSKFGDVIYADKQQSQENQPLESLPIKQAQTEPQVPSQNAILQESDQKAEAPSQLVNASENTAAQKQKAEPHTPNREAPVQTSHPVKFHVRNCEETLKAIESALKMPREKFIDGSSYISAGSPGYNLSFLVKSHVYEQVRPLQETLSIQTERMESVVKPEQQTDGGPSKCLFELGRRMKFII
ncbi:Hypothetical_protein [Hexamita inflata]|uniref:Hypothetical_protein n=1 Tax=Hexamita inflata TaxID=28002 RepID=A0AA86RGK8_9EUKA|nr:Hypothetical protein HINF_LOCUS60608 [Hexamita inflata]